MKALFGLFCCLIITTLSLNGQDYDTTRYRLLKPYDFNLLYLKTSPSMLIDVREPFEFKVNRIKGAINIPSSGNLERAADTLNREITYFLYCSTDYRSRKVADKLYEKGFRDLVILKGGIVAWKKDGLKTERKLRKKRK